MSDDKQESWQMTPEFEVAQLQNELGQAYQWAERNNMAFNNIKF